MHTCADSPVPIVLGNFQCLEQLSALLATSSKLCLSQQFSSKIQVQSRYQARKSQRSRGKLFFFFIRGLAGYIATVSSSGCLDIFITTAFSRKGKNCHSELHNFMQSLIKKCLLLANIAKTNEFLLGDSILTECAAEKNATSNFSNIEIQLVLPSNNHLVTRLILFRNRSGNKSLDRS